MACKKTEGIDQVLLHKAFKENFEDSPELCVHWQHAEIPYNGKFSHLQIFTVSINLRRLKSVKYFAIFDHLVLRNSCRLLLQFAVITSLKSVFFNRFCLIGKTSDMQLTQNNLNRTIW